MLYFRDWLYQFQVVQKTPKHLVFRLVLNDNPKREEDIEEIRQKSQMVLGDDLQVDFEYLSEIPPSSSGKYRYTISEVARS